VRTKGLLPCELPQGLGHVRTFRDGYRAPLHATVVEDETTLLRFMFLEGP
jgi:hypothetical protein